MKCELEGCDNEVTLRGARFRKYCSDKCRRKQQTIFARERMGYAAKEDLSKTSYRYQMLSFEKCRDWYFKWATTPIR